MNKSKMIEDLERYFRETPPEEIQAVIDRVNAMYPPEYEKKKIYLDDIRTPVENEWIVVRNYDEFVSKVEEIGFDDIELISLDHDLGESAMNEWHNNVYHNYELNYDNITEKTGYDCAKWLVDRWMEGKDVFDVYTHSANAIGSANIMGYINNYRHINRLPQTCVRVQIEHTIK